MSRFNKQTIKKTNTMPGDSEVLVTLPGKNSQYRIKKENLASELGVPATLYSEVAISSAEILSMGSSPIELLPDPGVDKYYRIHNMLIEGTGRTVSYVFGAGTESLLIGVAGGEYGYVTRNIVNSVNAVSTVSPSAYLTTTNNYVYSDRYEANTAIQLTTDDGSDLTTGDGVLFVKIWYDVRTLGSEL